MQRLNVVVLSLAALLCGLNSCVTGIKLNQLMVKYGVIPKLNNLFDMPRTLAAAEKEKLWAMADDQRTTKGYSLWCRDEDYRVCLMYDLAGSVAGIQVSHSVADIEETQVPQDFRTIPDWTEQTLLGTPVYSAIAYFEDPSTLLLGGRNITDETPTAEGIWIEQSGSTPMKIPFQDTELVATTKYTRQGCLPAQGQHYFYNLTKESGCVERGPYYMLYERNKGTMLGFGVIIFGKTSEKSSPARKWFLYPPYVVADFVTPNGPSCTKEWMKKYGSTSLHVFFREDPWLIACTSLGKYVDDVVDAKDYVEDKLSEAMDSLFG